MGKWMIYIVFVVGLLTGCVAKKNMKADNGATQIEDVKWQLVELKGIKVDETVNGRTPYLELRSGEKRYGANGGCNGIGGTYEISENNAIRFSQGFSTKMACGNMEIEQGVHELLASARTVALDKGSLMVKDDQDKVIARFKKMG